MHRTSLLTVAAFAAVAPLAAQAPREVRLTTPALALTHDFTQIRGVRELADGRFLVTDRLEPAVYVADKTGGLRKLGREGNGPGEYRLPGPLLAMAGDSTLLLDEGNARMAVYGPDLRVVRERSTQSGLGYGLWPRAVDHRGLLYFTIPGWASGPDGPPGDSLFVARFHARTGLVDTLARIRGPSDTPGHIHYGLPNVAFSAQDSWQATADGRVLLVRVGDYHLEWTGADGKPARGPAISVARIPVTQDDKIAYVRNFLENAGIGGRGGKDAAPTGISATPSEMLTAKAVSEMAAKNFFAPEKPPFTETLPRVAADGSLWVERSVAAGAPRAFDVFDGAGRVTLRVTLPANRRLVALAKGGVYLAFTTEDGLEKLERYPLP